MKTTLTLHDNGIVNVEIDDNGVFIKKDVSLHFIASLFAEAVQEVPDERNQKWFKTPILPAGTLAYHESELNHFILIMKFGPDILPFTFENTLYPAIPFPKLIFAFKGMINKGFKTNEVYVIAVKKDDPLNHDTLIYKYPFSHVSVSTKMCYGLNQLPIYSDLLHIEALPRVVLTLPNTLDHYSSQTNSSNMNLRDMLEELESKEEFPEEWLSPLDYTFGKWLDKLIYY